MAYLTDMPKTCRDRATRPEHALDLIEAIRKEFDKSFAGGIFDPYYVLPKLESLTRHVKWLAQEADREMEAQYGPADEDEMPHCDLGCSKCLDPDED